MAKYLKDRSASSSLESLEAYLKVYEDGTDAALVKLEFLDDPESIRRRINLLIKAGRTDEVVGVISDRTEHSAWVPSAIQAMVELGEFEIANNYVNWAIKCSDSIVRLQCLIAYCDGMTAILFKNREKQSFIVPGMLTADEERHLNKLIILSDRLLDVVKLHGEVQNELESQATQRLLNICYLAGDRDRIPELIKFLWARVPVPLRLAEAVLQGLSDCNEELPERLRNEHPKSVQALLYASLLEGRYLGKWQSAFENTLSLAKWPLSDEQKISVSEILYEISLSIGSEDVLQRAQAEIEHLLDPTSDTLALLKAHMSMRKGALNEAQEQLEKIRDDSNPNWLRLYASCLLEQGDKTTAFHYLKIAESLTSDPELLRQVEDLAVALGDFDAQMMALLKQIALVPEDIRARSRLARLYVESKNYVEAAEQFAELVKRSPATAEFSINLAVSLSMAGRIDEANAAIQEACNNHPDDLKAQIIRSKLLLSIGDSQSAFKNLQRVRESYWSLPDFLIAYLNAGYASGHESQANDALRQLQILSNKGLVDSKVMRAVPVEEVVELVKSDREQTRQIFEGELAGQMPWTLTADVSNEVPYSAWTRKTQTLPWIYEEPTNWAAFNIYATNYFRVCLDSNGTSSMVEIEASKYGATIVGDISALITIHNLDLLEIVSKFYQQIFIPIEYLSKIIDETGRLFPHQSSQLQSAQSIKQSIDGGKIRVLVEPASDAQSMARLDEYNNTEAPTSRTSTYNLADVIEALHSRGVISDALRRQAEKICSRSAGDAKDLLPLVINQRILVDLTTLMSIVGVGLLEAFQKSFIVFLSEKDNSELVEKLHNFSVLDNVRSRHSDFWNQIKSNQTFVPTARAIGSLLAEGESRNSVALAAVSLAVEKRIPLLVDDRVCQGVLLNEFKEESTAAFGTDRLLLALYEHEMLTISQMADCYLQMMEWRYRFMVIPSEVMVEYARRFVSHPPGSQLHLLSRYVHDCMRDPGLFAGMEPTEPPTNIALRFFRLWAHRIAEFVIDIWNDETFSEEFSRDITNWAILQCLPQPPSVFSDEFQVFCGKLLSKIVMSSALLRTASGRNEARLNAGLLCISSALGLSDEEYLEAVAEVANV